MAKSALEKELERNRKSAEKQARDQMRAAKKQAQEQKRPNATNNIISSFQTVAGFTMMNMEAEELLSAIIDQYDGNENLYINFDAEKLSRPMQEATYQYFDVLHQSGMISSYMDFGSSAAIDLTYSGRDYFKNKAEAEERAKAEKERKEKLETDIVKIQNMNADQLRDIYIQAVLANASLKESFDVEQKQLEVLKNLFVSGEDGVAVQKEIMKQIIDTENEEHPIRDYIADKGGDIGVAALTATAPAILAAIKTWLASKGVML